MSKTQGSFSANENRDEVKFKIYLFKKIRNIGEENQMTRNIKQKAKKTNCMHYKIN